MDILSVAGLIAGLIAIIGGSILKGAGVHALWNPAAFVIVGIGTFAAVFLHVRLTVFKHAFRLRAGSS